MSLGNSEIAHILLALVVLLVAAQALGSLFARFRQPPVIGEILAGILLGPTLFGLLLPELQAEVFPKEGTTATVLGAVYQLGLLLLMFCAGAEIRSVFHRGERKTALSITASGMFLPFLAGLVFLQLFDLGRFHGPAQNETAFLLVFAIALAVTSIPVISRIMFDLGIIATSFARIVLTAAVIEDILLYVVLAVALGLVVSEQGEAFGLSATLGFDPGSDWDLVYHVVAALAFFAFFLLLVPRVLRAVLGFRESVVKRASPIALQLAFMMVVTVVCVFLGVTPLLGAFVAGMVASLVTEDRSRGREAIKNFSFAFFVPVYFAIVGLRLDLVKHFDLLFFLFFLVLACLIKALSVYAGARLAGETRFASTNLAVAMNARGGPGIVLASVAFDAAIINESFYAILVMLAIVTSLFAGSWLERVVRGGRMPREPGTGAPAPVPARRGATARAPEEEPAGR